MQSALTCSIDGSRNAAHACSIVCRDDGLAASSRHSHHPHMDASSYKHHPESRSTNQTYIPADRHYTYGQTDVQRSVACPSLAGMEFTRREIVARIHIGEATLAKRVSEFATTAAGDLTLDEFDVRGREIENEQMALLENTQPSQEESVSGCRCIHIGEAPHIAGCADCHDHGIHCLMR